MSIDLIAEIQLDGVWTDITSYVRTNPGVNITFAVQGEAGAADANTCTLVVNNRDGRFTPRNAEGPWYGDLKKGIPLRVRVGSWTRFTGELVELPVRWDLSGNDVWTPITAAGPIRRLVRSRAVNSPLYAYLSGLGTDVGGHVTGYWPMEDAGGPGFASGFAGGSRMTTIAGTPSYASIDPGPGSRPNPNMDLVHVQGSAVSTPGSSQFTAGMLLTLPESGTADNARLLQVNNPGTAEIWVITYVAASGGLLLRAYDRMGNQILSSGMGFRPAGRTDYMKLEVYNSGGNAVWAVTLTDEGTLGGTLVGYQVAAPTAVIVGNSQSITGDVGVGHVVVADTWNALQGFDMYDAIRAFDGESVEDRMERVAEIAGVSMTVIDDGTPSTLLGPQPLSDPLTIMREAEQADVGGILYDSRTLTNALNYVTRRARYSDTAPVLELDYAAGHLAPPLEPTEDDQLLANDVTVTRTNGSSARAVDLTSSLNANPYPDGIGAYVQAFTLNVQSDDQLPDLAAWLLMLGTLDATRFPSLTLDLVAHPELAPAVDEDLRPGSLVTVTNLPEWSGVGEVKLHVLGWSEQIGSHTRSITLNCAPAAVYDVARLDSSYARLDSDTTTLSEDLDATETDVSYTGDTWTTTATRPTDFPFDIRIGPEVMTVTAATATVFTVVRGVNGVTTTHLNGAQIRLNEPARLAL